MYRIRKLFTIPIGHRLSKHEGLCKNIHGHNLKIEVQVKCDVLDNNDMAVDFGILKKEVKKILDKFDHTTLLNIKDQTNYQYCMGKEYRVFTLDGDPTAEMFSAFLFHEIKKLELFNDPNRILSLDFVRIWENENSMAEYQEGM